MTRLSRLSRRYFECRFADRFSPVSVCLCVCWVSRVCPSCVCLFFVTCSSCALVVSRVTCLSCIPSLLLSILTCGLGRDVVNGLLDGLDLVSVVVGDLESEFLS